MPVCCYFGLPCVSVCLAARQQPAAAPDQGRDLPARVALFLALFCGSPARRAGRRVHLAQCTTRPGLGEGPSDAHGGGGGAAATRQTAPHTTRRGSLGERACFCCVCVCVCLFVGAGGSQSLGCFGSTAMRLGGR